MDIVKLKDVCKAYPAFRLHDVSFSLESEKITGFIGRNGAGPDIDKAALLAQVYGVTIDSLMKTESVDGVGIIPPAQKGKNLWGMVTIGERGQIVIPKAARDKFGLKGGDRLIVASDEVGIALFPADYFESKMQEFMDMLSEQQ